MASEKVAMAGLGSNTAIETCRTAGLLALISAFLLVEGTVRTDLLINTPSGKWGGDYRTFPPAASIAGSVVEVLFGLTGLGVGLAQAVLGVGSPLATMCTIACQLLGWYTFVVWTIAAPAFNQARAEPGSLWPGLTTGESETITAMGIIGSVAVCFCLQGSQFFLAFKLLKLQQGDGAIYDNEYHRSRLGTFSFFVLLAGVSQLVAGAVLRNALGSGQFAAPVVAPPFMVFYPELSITTGCIVILYAFVLILVVFGVLPKSRQTAGGIAALASFVFVCEMAFQNLGQSFAGGALIIVGSQLVGLLFATTLFPAYLAAGLCTGYLLDDSSIAPVGHV